MTKLIDIELNVQEVCEALTEYCQNVTGIIDNTMIPLEWYAITESGNRQVPIRIQFTTKSNETNPSLR